MRKMPPGPRGLEVLGLFGAGNFERTLRFLLELTRRHGPIGSFRVLGRPMYVLDDPELLRQVLVVQQHRFSRAAGTELLRDVTGVNLATTDEPLHRERRRLLQPAFARHQHAAYGDVMAGEARRFTAARFDGEVLDIGAAMTRLTLDIASRALFGGGVDHNAYAMSRALNRAMRSVSQLGLLLEIAPPWFDALRRRLPLRANAEFRSARRALRAAVRNLIERNRGIAAADAGALGLVLSADGEGSACAHQRDVGAVGDELCALLFAGHETTATALTWAWYLLASNPDVAANLHAELDAVLGDRDPDARDLDALPYTAAVFAETLRLYPSAAVFGRRVLERCELGGYELSRGCGVIISPYVSHRNARYFPQPQRFLPERWEHADWPEFAYVPFGGGARRCIGEPFARMEGALVLATVARRYRFEREEAAPVGVASALLRPTRPIVVRAIARRSGARTHRPALVTTPGA